MNAEEPPGVWPWRSALRAAAPLVAVALAYGSWWVSDRLGSVGPLDRAAFGWVVVVPMWLAAPVVAGFSWRTFPWRTCVELAIAFGGLIGLVTATVFWQAVSFPVHGCETAPIRSTTDWLLPSLTLGAVVGGGFAASSLYATRAAWTGRAWRVVAVGAGVEIALGLFAILVATAIVFGGGCQRPHG